MKERGLEGNIENNFFGKIEMVYLAFWVTHNIVRPLNLKTKAIQNMIPENPQKGAHKFIGLVKYYWNIWGRHLHNLEPLNNLMSIKVKFNWTHDKHKAL